MLYVFFKASAARDHVTRTENGELMSNSDYDTNLVRFGDPLDGVGCLTHWRDGVCVNQVMRLFHAQMDGTITPEEKK